MRWEAADAETLEKEAEALVRDSAVAPPRLVDALMRWPWDVLADALDSCAKSLFVVAGVIRDHSHPPPTLQPGDVRTPCPYDDCGTLRPAAALYELTSDVHRNGTWLRIVTGQHYRCEECGKHWCSGPEGVWKLKTAQSAQNNSTSTGAPREEPRVDLGRSLAPIPKAPPAW